uniref:Uncharacterized protein n=1 Tax=Rhizophora mucronata TaxID=61149 RepID=A0A2P2QFJ9_RHIMU
MAWHPSTFIFPTEIKALKPPLPWEQTKHTIAPNLAPVVHMRCIFISDDVPSLMNIKIC